MSNDTTTPAAEPAADRAAGFKALLEPFPQSAVSRLPRSTCKRCSDSPSRRCDSHTWVQNCSECGGRHSSATLHLDYVGHADVTRRLLEVDPAWSWEPCAWGPDGLPLRDQDGGMWIRLTVLGVTRLGYGDAQGKRGPNGTKELIGDAIRNAAMRFGVAVDLWSKSDAAEERKTAGGAEDETPTEADPDTLAKAAAEALEEAASNLGNRAVLLPLYQRVNATPNLAGVPVYSPAHGSEIPIGEFIVWAGQQTPDPAAANDPASEPERAPQSAEQGEPAPCGLRKTGEPSKRCGKPEGHDGHHAYTIEEQA